MNTQTKVFSTLALSLATDKKIESLADTPDLKAAGKALKDAGFEATHRYPASNTSIMKNKDNIASAVLSLLSGPLNPQQILSMLIAGLSDIYAKCNTERHEIIDPVIYCAQACLDFLPDDDTDHEVAFERYMKWIS